jgi:single-stranded-DNA-specific exonuclease
MKNYTWNVPKSNAWNSKELEEYHPIIFSLLSQLDIHDNKTAKKFLHPHIEDLIPSHKLYDCIGASKAIMNALASKQKIFIHGDFDIDGIVATSILWDFLYRKLKADVVPLVPNRFDDGYGLSSNTLDKAAKQKAGLIITVDCGIKDIELMRKYPNIDFIITDHHKYPIDDTKSNQAFEQNNLKAIVHPATPNHEYPFASIAGATVAWKLIDFMCQQPQILKHIDDESFSALEYLGLVALATVGDIMPLRNENRIIVSCGIKQLQNTKRVNILSILEATGIDQKSLSSYHFGFVIGPRLNAAGRMQDAIEAVRLLCTRNRKLADKIITNLNNLNTQRQDITTKLFEEAEKQICETDIQNKVLIVSGEDWPEGIIGLVAGKLQEKYYLPTFAISINSKTSIAKGSARSIKNFDVTKALENSKKFLLKFGGHEQAAGFSLHKDKLEDLIKHLTNYAAKNIKKEDTTPILEITANLKLEHLNQSLLDTVKFFEPFGYQNPKPKFLFESLKVISIQKLGKSQEFTKLYLSDKNNKHKVNAMCFHRFNILGKLKENSVIDLVATVELNTWNGHSQIQLNVVDLKLQTKNNLGNV